MKFGGVGHSLFHKGTSTHTEEMTLNITSMADIFTIILVFLLKSFSTGSINITPASGTSLPVAHSPASAIEALKLEVSGNAILLESKPILTLNNFRFPAGDIQANQTSRALGTALERERKRQMLIAASNPSVKVDAKIIVVADQKTPYATLKHVLASAAVQGYTDFKLAVIQPE